MRRDYLIWGSLLILAGVLGLLQALGFLQNTSDVFWSIVFLLSGLAFLFAFARGQWWAAIPALTLIGLGSLFFLPATFQPFGGTFFLGAVGAGFWLVYLSRQEKWWAILPGGILLTLAAVAGLSKTLSEAWLGAIFFAGLAVTFLLVAVLVRMHWAYWPALGLGLVAGLILVPGWLPLLNYAWAAALIGAGIWIIWRSAFAPSHPKDKRARRE